MSESLADDRPPVSRGWIAGYGFMYLGINIAWAAPSQLLIANQILNWHPDNKEALLATIMAIGGLLGLIASPLFGFLSDSTKSNRLGRRAPWIIVGATACAMALIAMAFAPNFIVLVILWCVFQSMIAAASNPAQAIPPDRVSRQQYGVVSAVMGIGWTMAVVIGTLVGESLSIKGAYFATAGLMIALILPYLLKYNAATVLPAQEPQRASSLMESLTRGADAEAELSGVTVETERGTGWAAYKDFLWVFVSRLAVTLGNTVALFYLLYYLRDHVGLDDPDFGVLILTGVYALVVVGSSILSGKLSDKLGVRKPFVFFSCLGVATACGLMAVAHSFWVVIVAAVILGAGWGVFTAIDQALINQTLPHAATRGRDVGFMALAAAIPNLLAPVLAAFALLQLGGYAGLYLISGALAVVGALAVTRVKGSR